MALSRKRGLLHSTFIRAATAFATVALAYSQEEPPKLTPPDAQEQTQKQERELDRPIPLGAEMPQTAPEGTVSYQAPQHDVRFAIDFGFVSSRIAKFYGATYGDTIDTGKVCGKPRFLIRVNETPRLTQKGWLNYNGLFGTDLQFVAAANAKVCETCGFVHDPSVGAGVKISTRLTDLSKTDHIHLDGWAFILGWQIAWPYENFPFAVDLPFPGKPLSSIPVKLKDPQSMQLDFGSFQNNVWVSSGQERDLSLVVNAGGFDLGIAGGSYMVADAVIGTGFPMKQFPSAADANGDFRSDLPIWGAPTGIPRIGLSVNRSFFGSASPTGQGSGLFGQLLPIRAQGVIEGKFLFFHIKRRIEVYIDGAEAKYIPHDGSYAVQSNISTSRWTISKVGDANPRRSKGAVKSVTASMMFDRFMFDQGNVKFRVADFRIKVKTNWFVFPIVLSSGALEDSINHGTIPIATMSNTFSVALPDCVFTGTDILWARNGACPARPKWLSFESGTKSVNFAIDPSLVLRLKGDSLHLGLLMTDTENTVPDGPCS